MRRQYYNLTLKRFHCGFFLFLPDNADVLDADHWLFTLCKGSLGCFPRKFSKPRKTLQLRSSMATWLQQFDWQQESYPVFQDFSVLPFIALFFPSLRFILDRFLFEVSMHSKSTFFFFVFYYHELAISLALYVRLINYNILNLMFLRFWLFSYFRWPFTFTLLCWFSLCSLEYCYFLCFFTFGYEWGLI